MRATERPLRSLLGSLFGRPNTGKVSTEASERAKFFSQVYEGNLWHGETSRSGKGSEGSFAQQKIGIIDEIAKDHRITSILDFGCGDFYWMKEIVGSFDRYHGVDIVEPLIESNRERYGTGSVSFQCLDLSNTAQQKLLSVTTADLLVCVDVFGHLLNQEVDALLNFILNSLQVRLLLVTNRREAGSTDYLRREKSRHEGIDLEQHPLFVKCRPERVREIPGLHPNDFFDLYALPNARGRSAF